MFFFSFISVLVPSAEETETHSLPSPRAGAEDGKEVEKTRGKEGGLL